MIIYLAYVELGCGCQDRTIVGAFKSEQEAEDFAEYSLKLPENAYYSYSGVEEIELK